GRNVLGRRFFGYFLVAVDKKVTRSPKGRVEASALKQTKAKQKLDSGFRRNDKPKKQSRWMTSPTAVESPAKSMRG
ncbi:MAG: hypothetical protein IJI03_18185, partial [Rudaea sp.]|nr:hypothetical protein [Rudaea sp.]